MKKSILIFVTFILLIASIGLANAEKANYSFSTGSYSFDMPFELILDETTRIYHTSDNNMTISFEEKDYSEELKNLGLTTENETASQLMLTTALNAMDSSGLFEPRDKDIITYEKVKDIIIAHEKVSFYGMNGVLIGAIDNRGIILTMIVLTFSTDFDIDTGCQSILSSIDVNKD